jgi:hypothetical protein
VDLDTVVVGDWSFLVASPLPVAGVGDSKSSSSSGCNAESIFRFQGSRIYDPFLIISAESMKSTEGKRATLFL